MLDGTDCSLQLMNIRTKSAVIGN